MATAATASATSYTSDSAPAKSWGGVRRLIDSESHRHQKARRFPRLAIGVKLWIEADILPRGIDRKKHLEKQLRNSLHKHGIFLCDESVFIGFHDKGLLDKPVEIVIQWAAHFPDAEYQDLIQRTEVLGNHLLALAASAGKAKERSK